MKIEQKTIKYEKVLNEINKSKEKDRKSQELINTIFFIALAGSLFAHACLLCIIALFNYFYSLFK